MIEKNIFLIWFGKNLPQNIFKSLNMYYKLNPDFNIEMIYEPNMTHAFDIVNVQNKDLIDCITLIQSKTDNIYKQIFNREEAQWIRNNSNNQNNCDFALLSDAFRLYLLNKYGGIYVDVDTMPVKSFNDLTSYDAVQARTRRQDGTWYWDIYIIGFKQNYLKNQRLFNNISYISQLTDNLYEFKMLPEHFINNDNNSNEYIIHYFNNDWN